MRGFIGIFWLKNSISTDTNGSPADIHRSFRREKTVCICLFIRQTGRYNSLFGVDKTLPESTEMWKNIKGTKPDRIVVNI